MIHANAFLYEKVVQIKKSTYYEILKKKFYQKAEIAIKFDYQSDRTEIESI